MEITDKTGQPRSIGELTEARNALRKALLNIRNVDPVVLYYPCLIEAISELIERREGDERI